MNNLTLNGITLGEQVVDTSTGDCYIDPQQPWMGTVPCDNASGGGFKFDWDNASKLFETGLDLFKTFRTGTQQPTVPGAPPPPPAGVSLKKVALIGGGLALTGTIIYFATRKTKSK